MSKENNTLPKMDKENNMRSFRKAKAAPDFTKLHRQWDTKLQKGKAVAKKPLTEAQPFQLSQKQSLKSSSSGSDDFVCDDAAKENILNGDAFHKIETTKLHRATISAIPRCSQIKPSRPRSSFIASTKRSSLHTKDNRANTSTTKVSMNPSTVKRQIPPRSVTKKEFNKENATTALHGNFTSSVSRDSTTEALQGFKVDFKSDAAALNSILNGKGIERLPRSPPQQNNVLGSIKNTRIKGRVVPFSRPSAAARLNGNGRQQPPTEPTMNSAKQRWSIYSRDSYSSKPDLMDWLQKMIDDSKAKRAAAKQNSTTILSNSTISEDLTSVNDTKGTTNNALIDSANIVCTQSTDVVACIESTSTARTEVTTSAKVDNEINSFIFKKTLVGYQGDEELKSAVTNSRQLNASNILNSSNSAIKEKVISNTALSEGAYTTPVKNTGIPTFGNGSTVKSILKRNPSISAVKVEQPVSHTQEKSSIRPNIHRNSPVTPGQKSTKMVGTPVRFSAYARQQLKMGLPLPKENRYERFGEKVTGPSYESSVVNSPKSLIDKVETNITSGKSVRWADNLETSSGSKMKISFDEVKQSPAATPHHQRKNGLANTEAEEHFNSINNHKQTPFSFKRVTSPPPSHESFVNNAENKNIKLSPTSNIHKIKYVMPAEQPLEKSEKQQKSQVHKSLFHKSEEKLNLLQTNLDQEVARPLLPVETTNSIQAKIPLRKTTASKSWAQVLGEELNISGSGEISKVNSERQLLGNSIMETDPAFAASTKKTKKRNNKRISILEKIYGDAIKFRDVSLDSPTTSQPSANITGSGFAGFGADTSLGFGFRPVPSIDEKLIGDLMSFHESDSEDDDRLGLEDYSFFGNSIGVDIGYDLEEGEEYKSSTIQPFQSTLLATPSTTNNTTQDDVVSIELTPVVDGSITENPVTGTKLLEAPCKRLTKARTPYKQEMLDILERTLAAARKKNNNEDTLDCTIKVNNSTIVAMDDQAKVCEETLLDINYTPTTDSENVETKNLQNITGADSKHIDTNLLVGVPVMNCDQRVTECSTVFAKPSDVTKLNAVNISTTSSSKTPYLFNTSKHSMNNSVATNNKPTLNTTTTNTLTPSKAKISSVEFSKLTTVFKNPIPQTHNPAQFNASTYLQTKPQVTTTSFPAPPLFSSLSRDMKFSTTSDKGFDKSESDMTKVLKPSKFSFHSNSNRDNLSQIEMTLDESTFLDESDICMVFNKQQQPMINLLSKQQSNQMIYQPKPESPKINGSAFRYVNQVGLLNPSNGPKKSMQTIKHSYNKLRINNNICKDSVMCVDTEVAMYTKIGEMKKERGESISDGTLVRDGALNILAILLTYGDSKHFVPIDSLE